MNDHEHRPLPPELGEALAAEPASDGLAEVWNTLGAITPAPAAPGEREASWRAIQAGIARQAEIPVVPITRARRRTGWLAAAALFLVAGAGALALGPLATERVSAAPGARATALLPDGSQVQLDGGSTLSWRRGFRSPFGASAVRQVTLDGTAFFSVTHDGRPFVVRTYNASVRVLGTQFAVRARQETDGGGTAVEVREGRVAVRGAADSTVQLGAGERTLVAAGARVPAAVGTVPVERVGAWLRGGFAVVDAPLGAILRDLERHYGVHIAMRNPAAAAQRLTLYYPTPDGVAAILADLCTARGLTFRPVRDGFEVE